MQAEQHVPQPGAAAEQRSRAVQHQLLTSLEGFHKKSSGDQFLDPGRPWDLPRNLVFCPGVTHQRGKELFAEEVQADRLSTRKCNSASNQSGGKGEL